MPSYALASGAFFLAGFFFLAPSASLFAALAAFACEPAANKEARDARRPVTDPMIWRGVCS